MLKRYQYIVGNALLIIDACFMVLAWCAAYWLRFFHPFHSPAFLEVTKGVPDFGNYASLFPLVAGIWIGVLLWMGAYQGRRLLMADLQVGLVLRAHAVALSLFITLTYLLVDWRYSRLVMIYFGALGAVAMVATRFAGRTLLGSLRARGRFLRNVLAVGHGPALDSFLDKVERLPELGLRVVGIVTDEDCALTPKRERILGHTDQILELLRSVNAEEVLIALPPMQSRALERLLDLLKDETVDVSVLPDVSQYAVLGCDVEAFDGIPMVRINNSPVIGWGAMAKRTTDIIVSALALVILSPLLLLIAALVKLTSPGPVFYSQERMGLDGRSFRMFKFRSMRVDAEAMSGAVWARETDSRRTALGTFLRKTSLDELPQFWNVLCGQMSLVGPRPERPVFVQQFRDKIPHYMLRHKVQAGITGWAQVNGWRGNTSLDRRVECDLFYIRNWSYFLDLKILTMTLWKGFVNKNAY